MTAAILQEPITIPVVFVAGMLDGVRRHQQDCVAYLTEAGIPPQLLDKRGARVTASQYTKLFETIIAQRDDEMLGLLSRPMRRGSYALMVRDAVRASSLGSALARVARTFPYFQDDIEIVTQRGTATVGITLRFREPHTQPSLFLHELLLRVFWRLLAWLGGGSLPALGFDFAYARPAYADHYDRIFPGARRFNQAHSAFWIASAALERRIDLDEVALRAYLDAAARHVIVPWRADDVVSRRVRQYLQHKLPEWPGLEAVARALHMSTATLQRKLSEEGTSFQFVKDELRRDMAIVRLEAGDVSVLELALELGYADSSGFQRSFKRWTGSSTAAYRQRGS